MILFPSAQPSPRGEGAHCFSYVQTFKGADMKQEIAPFLTPSFARGRLFPLRGKGLSGPLLSRERGSFSKGGIPGLLGDEAAVDD